VGFFGKKYGERVIEIARFASKLDSQVIGGFSKLLKGVQKWAKEEALDILHQETESLRKEKDIIDNRIADIRVLYLQLISDGKTTDPYSII
jgi:hypothetical protein